MRQDLVNDLEVTIGNRLPLAYREFLIVTNGEYAGGRRFFIPDDESYDKIDFFYGFYPEAPYRHLPLQISKYSMRIGQKLIPIACDPFGNQICLSVRDGEFEKMYFWDHEKSHLNFLANGFDEFVRSMDASPPTCITHRSKSRDKLKCCIESHDNETLKALLDSGLRIDTPCGEFDDLPIEVAVQSKNQGAITMLIGHGAVLNDESMFKFYVRKDVDAIKLSVLNGFNVNTYVNRIQAPLIFMAIYAGDADFLKWLLDHGADRASKNEEGLSLFDAAYQCFLEEGRQRKHKAVMDCLRNEGLANEVKL